MCLELPVELVEVRPDGTAQGRSGDQQVAVSLLMLDDPVGAGDWVVAHAGFALHRITADEARAALTTREEHP